jgi:predicted nucleic acid-binding protein
VPKQLLIDTDVLIDFGRMYPDAVQFIMGLESRPLVSAMTIAELYAGVREGRERTELDSFVRRCNIVAVETAVAERGGLLFRQFNGSHGLGLADAIIGATALTLSATLVTLNQRHYPMLPDIRVP